MPSMSILLLFEITAFAILLGMVLITTALLYELLKPLAPRNIRKAIFRLRKAHARQKKIDRYFLAIRKAKHIKKTSVRSSAELSPG